MTGFIKHIRQLVQKQPNKAAFIYLADGEVEQQHLSYVEVDQAAQQVAHYLLHNSRPADRILLSYLPGTEFIIAFLGCLYAGRIAVPAYPLRNNQHAKRLLAILEDCQPSLILGTQDSLSLMQEHPEFGHLHYVLTEELDNTALAKPVNSPASTIAFLQYTSGSTGTPKGVRVTHGNILANMQAMQDLYGLTSKDKIVSWLPMQHDMGLIGQLLFALYCGTTEIFMSPAAFLEKPIRWLQAITKYKGCAAGGPNFGYALCVERVTEEQFAELDLSSWKIAFNGSEPIRAETLEDFSQKFKACGFTPEHFSPCYGMAETTLLISGKPRKAAPIFKQTDKKREVSSGYVHKSYSLKIVEPHTKKPLKNKEVGEIWVSGPCVADGYWNKAALNKTIFNAKLPKDKHTYLRTGDLGYLDNANLYVTGRLKDLIILQGRNVYPQDIEAAVEKSCAAVRQGCTAAFSIESNQQEQLVIVAEIKRTHRKIDFQPAFTAIRQAVQQAVEAIPFAIIFIMPATSLRTTSGKIQRQASKEAYMTGKLAILAQDTLLNTLPSNHKSLAQLEIDITTILTKVLAKDNIDPEQPFSLLGGTSLEAVTFQQQLQAYVGDTLKLSPTIAFDYPTVRALATYLHTNLSPKVVSLAVQEKTHQQEPIAIIGMSCRFPGGADSPEAFWQLLAEGREGISVIPSTRWERTDVTVKHAGLIENIAAFDAAFFSISPREAETMDPQQRWLLEETWKALENAAIDPSSLQGSNASVFIGATTHDYGDLLTQQHMHDSYMLTGNVHSVLSGRLSYALGLQGPSITLNTACSSSLVAVQQAYTCLQAGDSDLAIVGGVNALFSPDSFINLSQAQMLSSDGRCKVFADNADGYVRGEGCAVVILKKLSDALREGYTVLGIIKSAVVNQDGASSGLTVPNGVAQEKLLSTALNKAHLTASDIDYIETHGTGTKLGDPMETHAIAQVYKQSHTAQTPLLMGAVKANIGHLEAAAGIAGLIKVLVSLQHNALPPQPPIEKINAQIDLTTIPAKINTQLTPWNAGKKPRRAVISSFGFSGTNAQVIIEEAPGIKNQEKNTETQFIFPVSAKDTVAFTKQTENLYDYLLENPTASSADISHTLQTGRQHFTYRATIVAEDNAELIRALRTLKPVVVAKSAKVAWVFNDLYALPPEIDQTILTIPVVAKAIEQCSQLFAQQPVKPDLHIYVKTFVLQYALAELWKSLGLTPNSITGAGMGFYAAAVAANVLTLDDAIKLLMAHVNVCVSLPTYQRALIIFTSEDKIKSILNNKHYKDVFILSAINQQAIILSGPDMQLQNCLSELQKLSIRSQWISLLAKNNEKLNRKAITQYQDLANALHYREATCHFITADGKVQAHLSAEIVTKLIAYQPLSYHVINTLANNGNQYLLEMGNEEYIASWLPEFIPEQQLLCLSAVKHDTSLWKITASNIADFYKAGIKINWSAIRDKKTLGLENVILPTYPFLQQQYWVKFSKNNLSNNVTAISPAQEKEHSFYQVEWQTDNLAVENKKPVQQCLVFAPSTDAFAKKLSESTQWRYIEWSLPDANINNLHGAEKIVYFANENAENLAVEYQRLLVFLQHLTKLKYKVAIWIVTHRAYCVQDNLTHLAHAPLNGLIKTARLEHSYLDIRQIDIASNDNTDVLIKNIIQEITAEPPVFLIAYHNEQRYTGHLVQVTQTKPSISISCQENAYYLITGGLGSIGFVLAEWLIQHGAKHIVLVSRKTPKASQSEQINRWDEQGIKIHLEYVDLISAQQVGSLLQRYKHGLYPLKGIFHLAGSLDDAPLTTQTNEHLTRVFSGKAVGAWNLHVALEQQNILLDHFVLFSSIAALTGSPAQANYAAANAFLDALAFYRRYNKLAAISINWGPWAEIGMAKNWRQLHESIGFSALNTVEALQLLESALQLNPVHIGAFTADWQKVLHHLPALRTWTTTIAPANDKEPAKNEFLTTLLHLPYEQQLAAIEKAIVTDLKEILNLPEDTVIDKQQSFFTFGLDSLMGLQLINNLQYLLGDAVVIKYEHVLQKNSVQLFAEYLQQQLYQTNKNTLEQLPVISRPQLLPMSFSQERLWFLQQLDPYSRAYTEVSALEIKGSLDKERVEQVYLQLIQRHEGLRTRFTQEQDMPIQIIDEQIDWHLDYIDLRNTSVFEQDVQVKNILARVASQPFNLTQGPLFKALLIQLAENSWVKAIVLHHIIADGWSIGVMIREFTTLYNGLNHDKPVMLTPLSMQYADYSVWQREYFVKEVLNQQLAYWKKQLADAPLLNLPLDYPRPTLIADAGRQYPFVIPQSLTLQLKQLAQKEEVSLYMVLLTILYVLLARYSSQQDICIGSPIANRTQAGVENIIGFFVNMIVLRISADMHTNFSALLQQVKEVCLGAYAHQEVSFEKIVEALVTDRDTSRTPLFDVLLVLQNTPIAPVKISEIEFKLLHCDNKISKFDLTFEFLEINGELQGIIEYRSRLFKPETISRMAEHFLNLLTGFVQNLETMPAKIEFLTASEKQLLLYDWNNTEKNYPQNITIHEMFVAQALRTPDAVAIEFENKKLTYRELNEKTNQLSHFLLEQGVGIETVVAICMDRSIEMVVCILAILKAGATYFAIDPAHPQERIEYLLNDAQAKICLSCEPWINLVKNTVIDIYAVDSRLKHYSKNLPKITVKPLNSAYVIYTSGSTGKPKGVIVQHQSLINFICWISRELDFVQPMRLLFRAAVGFDVAVSDIFTPLLMGGTLIILPPREHLEPRKIIQAIKKHQVTYIELVPGQLLALLGEEAFNLELPLKCVALGGEAVSRRLIDSYYKEMAVPLFNTYGPSETTITSSSNFVQTNDTVVSIGNPIDNTQYYIIDRFNNLTPIGVVGELCIAGDGLARGYLNRPELTAEKFITEFFTGSSTRIYRTGDQVRYVDDGKIEFLGRMDHQVKLRGFRIELGEIENAIQQYAGIEQVVVLLQQNNTPECLVAYLTTKNKKQPESYNELRAYLKQRLPDYMIPAFFIFLDNFPLNASGKLDRKSLPAPDQAITAKSFVLPRNIQEKMIVEIFKQVLNVQQISIDDGFFELGGHSLLAVKVINMLREQMEDENLPLSLLFQHSTPRNIAESLETENYILPSSDILCLQSRAQGKPLFMVPGTDGYGLVFAELARQFRDQRKVYALQFPGLFREINFSNIDELAGFYIQTMRAVQPQGPYAIFGWSMGGMVAYAMAKQLQAENEQIEFLGIADLDPLSAKETQITPKQFAARILADSRFGVSAAKLPEVLQELELLPEDDLFDFAYKQLTLANSILVKDGQDEFVRIIRIFIENDLLLKNYTADGNVEQIYCFNATEDSMQTSFKHWQPFSRKPVRHFTINGNHFSMLQTPNVNHLAEKIINLLSRKIYERV